MGNQIVNIQNNTGTVNVYNADDKKNKNKETISIAAVDKYSSPLKAHIEMTRWGKNMHRVSFLMENTLIGQVLHQKYLTYLDKKEAKKVFDSIVETMNGFKKKAEEELVHSAILTPRIWKTIELYKDDLHKPESYDLSYRFTNQETIENFNDMPPGLVFHPVDQHFPGHEGIVHDSSVELKKTASKELHNLKISNEHNFTKRVENFNRINSKWISKEFDLKDFVSLTKPLAHDSEEVIGIKRKALLKILPLIKSNNKRKWVLSNSEKIDQAIDLLGEISLDQFINSKEINLDLYDLFIFDADRTIWDGDGPAKEMEPPYKVINRDTVVDSLGKKLTLKPGIRKALLALKALNKDLGLISKSEKKGVDYQEQPVILILKELDILKLFNNMVVVDQNIPKSAFIPDDRKTVFIDDDIENLEDVDKHTDAEVINANEMEYGEDDFDEEIEPLEVIEIKDGESEENLIGWIENDDEIVFPLDYNTFLKGRIKLAKKKDNVEYVECPKDCGPPSGSMGVHFELEKEDGKLWIPVSRKKEYDKTCKEIKEDLKEPMPKLDAPALKGACSESWYKRSKREYIPTSERPEKPKDGKDYDLHHKKEKFKGGDDKKKNLEWIEKNKHKKKSQESGAFTDGGNKKVKHEKSKGKEKYKAYQKSCGEIKQKKDREELGEAGYSKQQSEIAKKRWH